MAWEAVLHNAANAVSECASCTERANESATSDWLNLSLALAFSPPIFVNAHIACDYKVSRFIMLSSCDDTETRRCGLIK